MKGVADAGPMSMTGPWSLHGAKMADEKRPTKRSPRLTASSSRLRRLNTRFESMGLWPPAGHGLS